MIDLKDKLVDYYHSHPLNGRNHPPKPWRQKKKWAKRYPVALFYTSVDVPKEIQGGDKNDEQIKEEG